MSGEEGTRVEGEPATETGATTVDDPEPSTAQIAGLQHERTDAETRDADEDGDTDATHEPLFAGEDADRFRQRWKEIQSRFVDDPRRAVEEGDALVATLMQRLAETFSEERSKLEGQWDREEDASTEDLRVALQRYRSFFDRLLSA
jgi:hypothetical protein